MTVTFTPGTPCGSGNHFHVIVHLGTEDVKVEIDLESDMEPLTDDEKQQGAKFLVRNAIESMSDKTSTSVRAKLKTYSIGDPV